MSKQPLIISGLVIESPDQAVEVFFRQAIFELGLDQQSAISRSDKHLLIQSVVDKGGLHFRNCVRDLARLLDLSRTTVYNVINDLYSPKKMPQKVKRHGFS